MQEDANSRQPPEVWGGVEREIEKVHLLVVDPQSSDITGLGGIRRLRDAHPSHPSSLLSFYWHNWRTVRGDESDYVIRIVSRVLLT